MAELLSVLDHLVYATPDLNHAIADIEELLGVRAAIGGQHPGWGTRNALMSLGPRTYLELIGPDPDQPEPQQPRPFGIDGMSEARLVTWVVRVDDIQAVIDAAGARTVDLGPPQHRSRKTPNGSLLEWTMTDPARMPMDGAIPCFIDWKDSPHPAASSPGGCRLLSIEISHPEAERVSDLLSELGLDVEVVSGPVGIEAKIDSPAGRVVLR